MTAAAKMWEQYRHRARVQCSTPDALTMSDDLRAAVEATARELIERAEAMRHIEAVRGCCENEELHTIHSLIDQALVQCGITHADVGLPKSYPNSMGWIVESFQKSRRQAAAAIVRAEQAEERLKQITDLLGMPPGCSANRGGV